MVLLWCMSNSPFHGKFFSFALQCNPMCVQGNFRLKLQNSPKLSTHWITGTLNCKCEKLTVKRAIPRTLKQENSQLPPVSCIDKGARQQFFMKKFYCVFKNKGHQSKCLCICLSVYWSICDCLSVSRQQTRQLANPSVSQPVNHRLMNKGWLSLSICLSVGRPACLPIYLQQTGEGIKIE